MGNALVPHSLTLTPPATRVSAPEDIKIVARTLGNPLAFDIQVNNISRTGMLLEWKKEKFKPPFRENTLIELELKTRIKGEPRRINCLGKVVRKSLNQSVTQFGIRMIHNDEQDHLNWLEMVTSLEKNTAEI